MNNVKMFQAHKEAVRSVSFAPTDQVWAKAFRTVGCAIWKINKHALFIILDLYASDYRKKM